MGSVFSKRSEDELHVHPQAVGQVRVRETELSPSTQPPLKRRRKERKPQKDKSHAPPTRAMHQSAEPAHASPSASLHPLSFVDASQTVKRKKRKVAVFLGYIGQNYYGMQMNPGVITIEQVLLTAFHRAGLISEANKNSLSKIGWMRAARTDKGVSAAGQCISAKLECEVDNTVDTAVVNAINNHLPRDVQVYGMLRVTSGFNARSDCHRRRYEYMFPVRLLGGCNGVEEEQERGAGDPRCAKLTSILRLYEGTHCFANFTEGLTGNDDSARRYMIHVQCGQPFLPPNSGVYYVTVGVYGQSFLLHQIRKMVGLALFVYLGHVSQEIIPVALSPNIKIPTPLAPADGLLLDSLIFDNYNSRFKDTLDQPVSVNAFGDAKDKFKVEQIYSKIAERERIERVLESWVVTCRQKMGYDCEEVAELYDKFILTDAGREEQRKAYIASLYPIKTTMEDFLDASDEVMYRMASLMRDGFKARYGTDATFLARAPGRVILIGEHLDYNGMPVIATATSQGTMFAGCLDNTEYIEVGHVDDNVYGGGKLRSNGMRMAYERGQDEAKLDLDWLQYVSWGVKSLVGSLANHKRTVSGGGRLLVGGDLPRAGGLASSSSLVAGSALVAARLNRRRIPKQEIALLAAQGERVGAGTRGGAVDHTMSMCGVRGCALEISFTPHVGIMEMKLPPGLSLIAVGSGITAKKGFDEHVKTQFNLRAAECRIGAALLARRLNVHLDKSVTTPGQLLFQAQKTSRMNCKTIAQLKQQAFAVMPTEEVVSLELARKEMDVTEVEFQNRFLLGTIATEFKVGKRMAHVFTETERVEQFTEVVNDGSLSDSDKVERLGEILNVGQTSLREWYESSCAEVDELVQFCLDSGAVGSRMTGAGWGGYTINIVRSETVAHFLNCVIERVGDSAVLEISPSSGACIYAIHNTYGTRGQEQIKETKACGTATQNGVVT